MKNTSINRYNVAVTGALLLFLLTYLLTILKKG